MAHEPWNKPASQRKARRNQVLDGASKAAASSPRSGLTSGKPADEYIVKGTVGAGGTLLAINQSTTGCIGRERDLANGSGGGCGRLGGNPGALLAAWELQLADLR